MTRYTRYRKKFNSQTMEEEKLARLDRREQQQVESDKQQSVDDLRRYRTNHTKPVCLRCRKRGHALKYCPQGMDNICYNCGSSEHTLKACPEPRSDTLPHARCFVCGELGHLTNACPQNERGIYPRGGGCRFCGANTHLARDCDRRRGASNGGGSKSEPVRLAVIRDSKRENPENISLSLPASSSKRTKLGGSSIKKSKVIHF